MNTEIMESLKEINCLEEEFQNEVSCSFEDAENEIIISDQYRINTINDRRCEVYSVYENKPDAEEFILYVEVTIDEETNEKNMNVIECV